MVTDESGENRIVLDAGANALAAAPESDAFAPGDVLLVQADAPWPQNALAIERATPPGRPSC
ncbi:hypothetical protein QWJ90_04540 [Microbacterium oryzae]|uniref:hypothetical protein n=1 Tax=Microbacterium oryzae TaxID=743009 RepID=UPI0025B155C8|nr:hypothetical protein [Microbacterium oryzae]MDN3310189.1 hypothetical protein [Microbacterium oryzae]